MASNPTLNAEYELLCTAVGHLFIAFGRLEGTLSSILRLHLGYHLGADQPTREGLILSSAVYGSLRFKTSRDTIKRIIEVESLEKERREFLSNCFDQIGNIEKLRDQIAHQQVVPTDSDVKEYWQVTDAVTTRDIRFPKIYAFDTIAVRLAATDIVLACDRIGGKGMCAKLFGHPDFDVSPPTWLYKPSLLRLLPQNKGHHPLGHARHVIASRRKSQE